MNRHESTELAEQVAWLAAEHVNDGILGLDLAGNEAEFPAEPFIGIFKEAHQAGLKLTIHAGEWGPAKNVREAIEQFDADRIGHGVRVLEDADVTALARERNIPFEVCITSNYQSGVTPALLAHPLLRLLQNNLNVTLNTDDPSVSRITLSDEYKLACTDLGLTEDVLKERIVATAQASFLKDKDKAELVQSIKAELMI